jgi:homocitrate synthase NifV
MHASPYFIDTTLRDGEQAPGVAFSIDEKLQIAALLDRVGVPEVEVGIPAMGETAVREIRAIGGRGYRFKTLAWCRAVEQDIRLSADACTNGVHISFPVSDVLLSAMNKDRSWVMTELNRLVGLGLNSFEYVTVGAQDASRANSSFLEDFAQTVMASGASRLRLADTVGLLNPFTTTSLVSSIRRLDPDFSIEFHAHNDLGMACANTLAAWLAGADCLSTTVNGLGERAGNAAMEEVALALEFSANTPSGLNKTVLNRLSSLVESASGRFNSLSKPVTGALVLSHESGIHAHCMLKDRSTYQLIPAACLGQNEKDFLIGKHSGRAIIRRCLESEGIACSDAQCSYLLQLVREICDFEKRLLRPEELIKLYKSHYSSSIHSLCLALYNPTKK